MTAANKNVLLFFAAVILLTALVAPAWYFCGPVYREGEVLRPGTVLDSLDGVYVYYNGRVGKTYGRTLADEGYNIGLKYQYVEFVKRYYFEHYEHRMPDAWGHARDFFDPAVGNGEMNSHRGLIQFTNGSGELPTKGDIIISPSLVNRYGHVAIISAVRENEVEMIQQNPGRRGRTRVSLSIAARDGISRVDNNRVRGWLRMEKNSKPNRSI